MLGMIGVELLLFSELFMVAGVIVAEAKCVDGTQGGWMLMLMVMVRGWRGQRQRA